MIPERRNAKTTRLPRTPNFARVQQILAGVPDVLSSAIIAASLGGDPTTRARQAAAALRSAADELDPRAGDGPIQPTHWMPLPTPPVSEPTKEDE